MSWRRFNVAERGPPDPILVRYPGSDATTSLLAYILCLHGRVPEKYKFWSLNSLGVQTSELVLLRHTPMHTDNVGKRRSGVAATRIANQDGIWRPTLSDNKMAPTHGDIETISEKLAYRKFIKDSEFETRKVLEQENIERENIRNIETR